MKLDANTGRRLGRICGGRSHSETPMSACRAASTTLRRPGIGAIRFLLVLLGIVGLSAGGAWFLTDTGRIDRPASIAPRRAISRTDEVTARSQSNPVAQPRIPLYSEDWTEDSGQGLAVRASRPITDPQSLEQIRTSDEGRGHRGIEELRHELAAVDRRTPAGRAQVMQLEIFLGLLHMSVGEFTDADSRFAAAQAADPNCPLDLLANIEALRGVAALRRGETENCVACCNGSSCIFPLAPAAVHQSPSGSREAVRRFTTYLEQRPQDLGVQWLLNVACMTLGDYPDRVPSQYLIPLGPFQSDGGVGRLENVAERVGLSARREHVRRMHCRRLHRRRAV